METRISRTVVQILDADLRRFAQIFAVATVCENLRPVFCPKKRALRGEGS